MQEIKISIIWGKQKLNSIQKVGIHLLKVNKRNSRTRCEICSKLTIKISERRQWRESVKAAAHRHSLIKLLWKVSANSQKNACEEVSFYKL